MEGTQKLRPVGVSVSGRLTGPLVIAGFVLAATCAYVALALRPQWAAALRAAWDGVLQAGRGGVWILPLLAAVAAVLGVVLAAFLLSAFVRGVQAAPYAWLAPVLVGFSSFVLARMRIDLPLGPVPAPLFATLSGLLLLGGGALAQVRGWPAKLSGALALGLPLLLLGCAYARAGGGLLPAWRALDPTAGLFLFVLGLTSVGVALVAAVARPAGPIGEAAQRARSWREHRQQLAQALNHARESELRAAEAERRAELAEHALQAAHAVAARAPAFGHGEDTGRFMALARPPLLSRTARLWIGAPLLLVTALLVAYLAAYRPLARRAAAQQVFSTESAKEHAEEIDALRKRFATERQHLYEALAAERAHSEQLLQQAREQAATQPAPSAERTPAAVAPEVARPVARAVRHATRANGRHARRHAARSRARTRTQPAKREAAQPRESGETLDDDPIGGLEGM